MIDGGARWPRPPNDVHLIWKKVNHIIRILAILHGVLIYARVLYSTTVWVRRVAMLVQCAGSVPTKAQQWDCSLIRVTLWSLSLSLLWTGSDCDSVGVSAVRCRRANAFDGLLSVHSTEHCATIDEHGLTTSPNQKRYIVQRYAVSYA